VKWSESENVVWRAEVPGRGHSSPTVVGDRVFLTTADESQHIQFVLAFDRRSGKPLWKVEISRGGFPNRIHNKNTHATPTVASDGERLFANFFHHETVQATALDFDGKKLWQKTVGPFNPTRYEYGYAPSPLIYRGSVIFAGEYDGDSFIAAFDRATGNELWRKPRPRNVTYSTPVVAHVAGRDQMLISGANMVSSYDPATGAPLWSVQGTTAATCGTMVWDGDTVFASGGYPGSETLAIRAAGRGEVLWRNNQKCYEQSMLVHDGHLYALTDAGILYCWRGSDGQEMWKERLQGPISASPVLAAGHVYWTNERGTTFVFRPDPRSLQIVAENQLGDEGFASPAMVGPHVYLRTAKRLPAGRQEYLYCIGQ
jgi:outer membrane protein assembly factor BamB